MNTHQLLDTAINAGVGLRLFQAFARALPAPDATNSKYYHFFFVFVQNLADNKDRDKSPVITPPVSNAN